MVVLEVPRAVLRGLAVEPEVMQGQAVRPAVELQDGRHREAERTGH